MEHVNDTIMASCAAAVVDACYDQLGDQNMPYHVCENGTIPITRDLGWYSPDDFNYTALIGCVSSSAPLCGLTLALLFLTRYTLTGYITKAHGCNARLSNGRGDAPCLAGTPTGLRAPTALACLPV